MQALPSAALVLACALFSGEAAAAPATRPPSEVEQHLERGIALYKEDAIDASIAELEQAYALDANASVCYALGQARRKKGDCKRAIELYRCAVAKAPDEAFARAANYQIGRCVVERGVEPEPAVAAVTAQAMPPPKRPWHRDTIGGTLLGMGLAGVAAGAGILGYAEALARAAPDDLEAYRAAGGVGTQRIAGGVVVGLGGLAVVGAVVRWIVVARR